MEFIGMKNKREIETIRNSPVETYLEEHNGTIIL